MREIGAARVGDGRNTDPTLAFCGRSKAFQPLHAGFAEAFGVGHDVGLRHRHEIGGVEELPDLDLVSQRELRQRAGLACKNVPFFVVEFHQSIFTPASLTALPHLASSAF